jgi:hypothetical protein
MHIKSEHEFTRMFSDTELTPTQKRIQALLKENEEKYSHHRSPVKGRGIRTAANSQDEPPSYCPLPPESPADLFYQALVREFGRYLNGGEVIWELVAIPGRRIRFDAALPRYKVGIEMDGWEFHGKYLKDFKKDRDKALTVQEEGWIVLWVSREMAVEQTEETIGRLKKMLAHRKRVEIGDIKLLPKGWSKLVGTGAQ